MVETADCNCRYAFTWVSFLQWGGCIIDANHPAPEGYLCQCRMPFFFTCNGKPTKCHVENAQNGFECLGGIGKDSCNQFGNCDGYIENESN